MKKDRIIKIRVTAVEYSDWKERCRVSAVKHNKYISLSRWIRTKCSRGY